MSSDEPQERRLVQALAERMLRKLRKNSHKRHWDRCEFRYLMVRLRNETNEIVKAWQARREHGRLTQQEAEAVADECADVANFAAMIAEMALDIAKESTP